MTFSMCIAVGILFGVSAFLMLSRDLKAVCIGIFLLGHGANLAIIAVSRTAFGSYPPILGQGRNLGELVDPLPQALVLTAIVIGFAVQAFLLTLLVITHRRANSVDVVQLSQADESSTPTAPALNPEASKATT